VLGLALVGLAVVAVLAVRAWGATAAATPTPVSPTAAAGARAGAGTVPASGGAGPAGPGASSAAGTGTGGPRPSGTVVVHVIGQVKSPGVVRLDAGSRVEDAVRAAGGAAASAQLAGVNLARVVVDGEQIVVPAPGEPQAPAAGAPAAGAASGPGGASGRVPGQRIDLNSATVATLDTLPGVGPVTAQKIVDWRAAHGRFSSVDELAEVPGIGPKLLEQLAPLVRV
jgi:competence protein ComEA